MKTKTIIFFPFIILLLKSMLLVCQETQIIYLSGTGSDSTVDWEFYCNSGMNSGKWTTIPVPSNWELQGFGAYNYGYDPDSSRANEQGFYKYIFLAPVEWQNKIVKIVFEGSMTDTEVRINGQLAGPIHQGSFYRFKYDISNLLKYGENNLLEVKVSKISGNESVNKAERNADYWVFGGIFRPVYLEIFPEHYIENLFIDADANGHFKADVYLSKNNIADAVSAQIYTIDGKKVGEPIQQKIEKNNGASININVLNPNPWSPEFPELYKIKVTLLSKEKIIHEITEKFGFRTIEVKERDGIYLNGVKIKFKGVNRHSFWPTTGRALNKNISIEDVKLMKDMNMNVVRNSHYPADEHLYEVCDSLGLMVLDELAGWHDAYDTAVGEILVKEMLEKNMNHPSIVMWINGNEGGHNYNLDPLFDSLDIQKRPVIHAWELFRGMDTQHYRDYNYGTGSFFQGHDIFFPTEFLHGMYDGGHGAGLEDFWNLMWNNPLSAGGLTWVFADEGVIRTDKDGIIDTDGNHGADGILGPFHEKEGSYYTIKEIWSPIFFEHREITTDFDGTFKIENRFSFTNINQCNFTWKLAQMPNPYHSNKPTEITEPIIAPDISPGEKGWLKLELSENWHNFDVLYITAFDPFNNEIYTWSWPISLPNKITKRIIITESEKKIKVDEKDSNLIIKANNIEFSFSKNSGLLSDIVNTRGRISFNNGPSLCEGISNFKSLSYHFENKNLIIENQFNEKTNFNELKWVIYPSGWIELNIEYCPEEELSVLMGINFSYPEKFVKGIEWYGNGPYRVWKNRMKGTSLNVWEKDYNNTVTGQKDFIYPEFKGFYSNMYWLKIISSEQNFLVVCPDEDVFFRMYTPETPVDPYNTSPPFPSGDISFLHGIAPIGTKPLSPSRMGPMSHKNIYYTYNKTRCKKMVLYFDFSGSY